MAIGDDRWDSYSDNSSFWRLKDFSPCDVIHPYYVTQTSAVKRMECRNLGMKNIVSHLTLITVISQLITISDALL